VLGPSSTLFVGVNGEQRQVRTHTKCAILMAAATAAVVAAATLLHLMLVTYLSFSPYLSLPAAAHKLVGASLQCVLSTAHC
jgi:hypothetical protein